MEKSFLKLRKTHSCWWPQRNEPCQCLQHYHFKEKNSCFDKHPKGHYPIKNAQRVGKVCSLVVWLSESFVVCWHLYSVIQNSFDWRFEAENTYSWNGSMAYDFSEEYVFDHYGYWLVTLCSRKKKYVTWWKVVKRWYMVPNLKLTLSTVLTSWLFDCKPIYFSWNLLKKNVYFLQNIPQLTPITITLRSWMCAYRNVYRLRKGNRLSEFKSLTSQISFEFALIHLRKA